MKRFFLKTLIVAAAVSFLFCTAYAKGKNEPPSCIKTVSKKYVCLTIDDGWNKTAVSEMLDVLRNNEVHCTLFIVGSRLKPLSGLWRKAIKDGHEICYHTMHHKSVLRMSNREIALDLRKWRSVAHMVLGRDYAIPKLVRLPGGSGSRSQRILNLFYKKGYKVIYWSMDTLSYRNRIVSYIKGRTKPGAVILTHFNKYDKNALPKYIKWLKSEFTLCKLSEALSL